MQISSAERCNAGEGLSLGKSGGSNDALLPASFVHVSSAACSFYQVHHRAFMQSTWASLCMLSAAKRGTSSGTSNLSEASSFASTSWQFESRKGGTA